MAFAFAAVTVFGGIAHVCHESAHLSASHAVGLHDHASGVASIAHHDDGHALPGADRSSHTHADLCCADLMCHGGIAFVSSGIFAPEPSAVAERFALVDQKVEGRKKGSLDRPPKDTVRT